MVGEECHVSAGPGPVRAPAPVSTRVVRGLVLYQVSTSSSTG